MEKFFLKSLLLLSPLLFAACSPATEEPLKGIDDHVIVNSSFTEYNDSKISGTGTLRFSRAFANTSSLSFSTRVSLDDFFQSSLVFSAYNPYQNLDSAGGVHVTFSRNGSAVTGSITLNGQTATINSSNLIYYVPTALDLVIDVHNIPPKTRVMIWRRDRIQYAPETADVDTARAGDLLSALPNAVASGSASGLKLTNATTEAAKLSTSKVLD